MTASQQFFLTENIKLFSGSPFIQEIDELTSPTASGPGLKAGIPAEPAQFKIDARGFPGEISVEVQGEFHFCKKETQHNTATK